MEEANRYEESEANRTFILPEWAMVALREMSDRPADMGDTLLRAIAESLRLTREARRGTDILLYRDGQYRRLRWLR